MTSAHRCTGCGGPRPSVPLVIRERDELVLLTRWFVRRNALCIALQGSSVDENRALQQELERDYLECGCRAGSYGLLIGVVISIASVAMFREGGTSSALLLLPLTGGAIGLSLAAKGAAILRARLRLARRVQELLSGVGPGAIR